MAEIVMESCLYKSAWSKSAATKWNDVSGSNANAYRNNSWYHVYIDNNSNQHIISSFVINYNEYYEAYPKRKLFLP